MLPPEEIDRFAAMKISTERDEPASPSSFIDKANTSTIDGQILQLQVEELKALLLEAIYKREEEDLVYQRAMMYASAKGTENAVLHALFDQASAGKYQVIESFCDSGVIPTRDGLKHWRLDIKTIRNETGATLLHTSVDASMARQHLKVKLVELLIDRVGFDVNVRDVFGRTPLHVAAMAGLVDVVKALLDHGADATICDRSGSTALSMVRSLSRPPEEVVQILAALGGCSLSQTVCTHVPRKKSIISTLFLQNLKRYVQPHYVSLFTRQTNQLFEELMNINVEATVDFDQLLCQYVPVLGTNEGRFQRVETLFVKKLFQDETFLKDLKIEAAAYGLSLTCTRSNLTWSGPTWAGWLFKLIQAVTFVSEALEPDKACRANENLTTYEESRPGNVDDGGNSQNVSPPTKLLTPLKRQPWHYAVLMKAASHPFPVTATVEKGNRLVICESSPSGTDEVSQFFPLSDRLLIGTNLYHCVDYNAKSRQITLDREYEGTSAKSMSIYISGSCSSFYPPYIRYKRIWECPPGNKFEDHSSDEQELLQDYQFMHPNSEYEIALKLGPAGDAQEAKALVNEWQTQARQLFYSKTCCSNASCCEYYCPQRLGHSLCVESMIVIGRECAKARLGRSTFSKAMKARASLQKYQNLGQ